VGISRPSEATSHLRLVVIVLMIVTGAALIMGSEDGGKLPTGDWYASSRQAIIQADLMYRMASYWDSLTGRPAPFHSPQWRLRERALAEYEHESLVERPNPVALHRLGIIYGERGYSRQAQQVLNRAATLDEERAGLYFALTNVYASEPRKLSPPALQRLRQQEEWLADLSLSAYYRRLDPQRAHEVERQATEHTRRFGMGLLLTLAVYGGLGIIGAVIVLLAIIRRGFYVQPPPPVRPPMLVPWEPLDAIEAVGVLYFGMAVMGVGSGLLLSQTPLHHAPASVRVILTGIQYLLFTGVALAVLWHRIKAPVQRRWRVLGLRTQEMARLLANGIGGYGVLVVALVAMSYMFSGGQIFGSLPFAQAGERLVSSATSPGARILLFVLICVIAPILEEMIFRGFVYPGLRRRMPVTSAVLASALLFALMHNNLDALFTISVIGITLAVLYERTRSLVPCIVCHALNNTLVFFLLLLTQ